MVALPKAPRKKPPFPYFGGKQAMVKHLVPLLPPHDVYVEIFGGAASLLFGKHPSQLEVYNDIDGELVNFFRVLRNDASELIHLLELTPYARDEWRFCHKHISEDVDDIERARRFYTATYQTFGSDYVKGGWKHSLSCQSYRSAPKSWVSNIDSLMDCAKRLRTVQIEHETFTRLICAYDASDVLFYADPPYVPETRKSGGYRHEMTTEQHIELLELLTTCKGMVLLSGYNCPLYQKYLADWQRIDIDVIAHTKGSGVGANQHQGRIESIWVKPNTIIPSQQSLF